MQPSPYCPPRRKIAPAREARRQEVSGVCTWGGFGIERLSIPSPEFCANHAFPSTAQNSVKSHCKDERDPIKLRSLWIHLENASMIGSSGAGGWHESTMPGKLRF